MLATWLFTVPAVMTNASARGIRHLMARQVGARQVGLEVPDQLMLDTWINNTAQEQDRARLVVAY